MLKTQTKTNKKTTWKVQIVSWIKMVTDLSNYLTDQINDEPLSWDCMTDTRSMKNLQVQTVQQIITVDTGAWLTFSMQNIVCVTLKACRQLW